MLGESAMPIEIRETKVIPDGGGIIVQMLISDEPPGGPDPKFSVLVQARPDFAVLPARLMLATIQLFTVQAVQKQMADMAVTLRKSVEKPPTPDPAEKPE